MNKLEKLDGERAWRHTFLLIWQTQDKCKLKRPVTSTSLHLQKCPRWVSRPETVPRVIFVTSLLHHESSPRLHHRYDGKELTQWSTMTLGGGFTINRSMQQLQRKGPPTVQPNISLEASAQQPWCFTDTTSDLRHLTEYLEHELILWSVTWNTEPPTQQKRKRTQPFGFTHNQTLWVVT